MPEIIPFEPDPGYSGGGSNQIAVKAVSLEGSGFFIFRSIKMKDFATLAAENLAAVRQKCPLIHNITNYVVMNYTANALLSIGASPVMAHSPVEVEEMVAIADALVINIGTLSAEWVNSMMIAGKKASQLGKPIILDPVGSGATEYRTFCSKKIIDETRLAVIRGNASEILSLTDQDTKTKGVDSSHRVSDAEDAAKQIAKKFRTVTAVTGSRDMITDGERILRVSNGHSMMGRITGSGCAATAIIGAFLTADKNPLTAAATALAFFGLAGEVAAENASAPGTYMIALLDALYTVTPEQLKKGCRIEG